MQHPDVSGADTPFLRSCLLRQVRLVPVTAGPGRHASTAAPARNAPARNVPARNTPARNAPARVVDVRITRGVVTEVAPRLARGDGETAYDGGGRWLLPGLWDQHIHLQQWALRSQRLDLDGTRSPADCLARVSRELAAWGPERAGHALQAWGYRLAAWDRAPSVADLDAVTGARPAVLISADMHNGWLNTAALRFLGVAPRAEVLSEDEWFSVFVRLADLPGAATQERAGYRQALAQAAALGVVGIVDMELADNHAEWPARVAAGLDTLKVRAATYRQGLDRVLQLGLRTGDPLGCSGLVSMGPLKIISDGSLNTRTAFCCEPFADADDLAYPRGRSNVSPAELTDLLIAARDGGLTVAVHAIGDAAVRDALDVMETTGAAGSIEHAQLIRRADLARMARLTVAASVQPAHLLDDRDVTARCWPDRMDRCFALGSMVRAGVDVRFGSDAPVAPLDPWLAMSAAVHRSADDRPPWEPDEALSPAQALAASTDGQGTVAPGAAADLVLLDDDPLAVPPGSREAGAYLKQLRPAATLVAGRLVYDG